MAGNSKRKSNAELCSEMEGYLCEKSTADIICILSNYMSSSDLEDFNDWLETENM